jgi:hypothetical protein
MKGDPGPYMETDGSGVWVPRTVPFREAWNVARQAVDNYGDVLRYRGKVDATLLGFTRDCQCDEVCELANRCRKCQQNESWCECEEPDLEDSDICMVPAWHFETVERGEP